MPKFVLGDLLNQPTREYILLTGRPKSGKTYQLLLAARYLQAQGKGIILLDTESSNSTVLDGLKKIWVKQFPDVQNIDYYPCNSAQDTVDTFRGVLSELSVGKWFFFESGGRFWELSQDAASLALAGMTKDEYISLKYIPSLGGKRVAPTPEGDKYWPIAKDYFFRQFFDIITNSTFNTLITSTLTREESRNPFTERGIGTVKVETGLPIVPDGAPALATYPDTLLKLERVGDKQNLTVYGDRGKALSSHVTFPLQLGMYEDLLSWRENG